MSIMLSRATALSTRVITGLERGEIDEKLMQEAADQVFQVLGELKGAAMKIGQALSVMEVAVPPQFIGQYKDALVKLQAEAPPMPVKDTYRMLAMQLGTRWRARFESFDDDPIAAASIGQVHRAVWGDGRAVAVKVQYPEAEESLRADLKMLQMFSAAFNLVLPGTDVKALVDEFIARTDDELDYRIEADYQRKFARALGPDDPKFFAPKVVASAPKIMVSEWMEGTPLSRIIASGTQEQRDAAGTLLAEFLLSSPQRVGYLHCDPHPGNFQLLPDGRLGVIDFGACLPMPHGIPPYLGEVFRLALAQDFEGAVDVMRRNGFVKDGADYDVEHLRGVIQPHMEKFNDPDFRVSRKAVQETVLALLDVRNFSFQNAMAATAPEDAVELPMLARVAGGIIGICAQLDSDTPILEIMERWLPGFAAPEHTDGEPVPV
ncbi:ABC1 kinase family protein [Nocardia acididurans]|nr:AarF/UbiB family protein [Nocardia acididurans]